MPKPRPTTRRRLELPVPPGRRTTPTCQNRENNLSRDLKVAQDGRQYRGNLQDEENEEPQATENTIKG